MIIKLTDSETVATKRNGIHHPPRLYYFPGACALADHIALEWIGAPYETVRMTHASIKSADYLALNPVGAVPLLIDGDFSLTENIAILSYLADLHPGARLLGDGTLRGRAKVMRWLGFLNSDVHGAFKPIFSPQRYLADPAAASAIADMARDRVSQYLEFIDDQLEGRDWLTGERSAADPYLFVMLRWAIHLAIDIRGLNNLSRFIERMQGDPSVRAAIWVEESGITERQTVAVMVSDEE